MATLFWGNLPDDAARVNLRQAVSNLRKLVGNHLLASRRMITLNRDLPFMLDIEELKRAIDTPEDLTLADNAVTLHRGEFLEGLYIRDAEDFEEWLIHWREINHGRYMRLLTTLGATASTSGEYDRAAGYYHRMLSEDRWNETAHRGLMLALASGGHRDAALAQYDKCARILMDELGEVPQPETIELCNRIRRHEFETHARSLPVPPNELLGRHPEREHISNILLGSSSRLLTLLGPGGIGKTRLAIEATYEMSKEFRDGVCYVPLAPVLQSSLVLQTVAQSLGVQELRSEPLIDTLKSHLREKHMLLLIDNFEQVAAAAAQVAELLSGCPDLKVLVTSRTPLHIRGEQQFRLSPLSLPNPKEHYTYMEYLQFDAVKLFIERFSEINPDHEITPAEMKAITEICARLDGLPLAIELAVARSRMFTIEDLLARLSRRLDLLTLGAIDLPDRQQTLRATLDWSFSLLSKPAQTLFIELSVFRGGRSLRAIEEIFGMDRTLDSLQELVEHSLIYRSISSGRDTRFLMLETIHEYAYEKLRSTPDFHTIHRRHARFFLALAEQAKPMLSGPNQKEWITILEQEHDNFRSALNWCLEESGDTSAESVERRNIGLRIAYVLGVYWYNTGHFEEGKQWLITALDRDPGVDVYARAHALTSLGSIVRVQGDYINAERPLRESLDLFRSQGNENGIAYALENFGLVVLLEGKYELAKRSYSESLDIYRAEEDYEGIASALNNLGWAATLQGDIEVALTHLKKSVETHRLHNLQRDLARTLHSLGLAYTVNLEVEKARESYMESIQLAHSLGQRLVVADSLQGLSCVYVATGNDHHAAILWGAADAIRDRLNAPLWPAEETLYHRLLSDAFERAGKETWQTWVQEGLQQDVDTIIYNLISSDPAQLSARAPDNALTHGRG